MQLYSVYYLVNNWILADYKRYLLKGAQPPRSADDVEQGRAAAAEDCVEPLQPRCALHHLRIAPYFLA